MKWELRALFSFIWTCVPDIDNQFIDEASDNALSPELNGLVKPPIGRGTEINDGEQSALPQIGGGEIPIIAYPLWRQFSQTD